MGTKKISETFHSHTIYCKHATNTCEEMVNFAFKDNYKIYGISEHICYLKTSPNYTARNRLDISELEEYLAKMNSLKNKYSSSNFKLYTGFECEYMYEDIEWYQKILMRKDVDYLIFGNHNHFPLSFKSFYGRSAINHKILNDYCERAIKGLKSGLYLYFAHPDLFMHAYKKWDEKCIEITHKICKAAKTMNIALGFNVKGYCRQQEYFKKTNKILTSYPNENFWKIVSTYNIKVVIEVDAHSCDNLNSNYINECFDLAKKWNLNVIYHLDLEKYAKQLKSLNKINKKF